MTSAANRRPLVVVGCGGFGREVLSIARAIGGGNAFEIEGFVDDAPAVDDLKRIAALGAPHLGSVPQLAARRSPFAAVIAVGSPAARMRIAVALAQAPVVFPVLVHPDATVAPDAVLGPGSIIAPGARISTNVTTGLHTHVDQNATVGHDCRFGDFVRLNPQACVSGCVEVGTGALIGASATVLQGLHVGDFALVGAAACVVRDVPARTTVKGVPAR